MKSFRIYLFLWLVVAFLSIPQALCLDESVVTIDYSKPKGIVRRAIFGTNALAHGGIPSADYGYGLWNPKWKKFLDAPVELLRSAGVGVLRFPGGCGTHAYDWKKAVNVPRKDYLFGVDEFVFLCQTVSLDPVITLSYFIGDANTDALLAQRLLPMGVKFYEVGNEIYHGNHDGIEAVSSGEYADKYLKYFDAFKQVDQSLQMGIVLLNRDWDAEVMRIVKGKVDFGIVHYYPTAAWGDKVAVIKPNEIYAITLAKPLLEIECSIQETLRLLKQYAGKDIPLAVTEFNGGFVQDKPVPYRHCLGTALVNAEMLRIFMKPENNILMANYWNFCNEYWGMVANGFDGTYKTLYNPYYKRPNYYVFEMYHKYFGDILLEAKVDCETYDASIYQSIKTLVKRIKTGTVVKNNLLLSKWEIHPFEGAVTSIKEGVLEVKFIEPKEFNYYHARIKADVEKNTYYKVSGYIKTVDYIDDVGVCLEVQDARGWNLTKSAASTGKVTGSTDWQYVEAVYETLPDAKEVMVIARRIGDKGPLKGKAYFKDVRLEKFIPSLDTKIPYLSVNASKNADGSKVYLMVINKNMEKSMTTTIDLKDFHLATKANAWILNGPTIDATNEKDHNNVKITHKSFEIKGNPFDFTFEPHSLTAIELTRTDAN